MVENKHTDAPSAMPALSCPPSPYVHRILRGQQRSRRLSAHFSRGTSHADGTGRSLVCDAVRFDASTVHTSGQPRPAVRSFDASTVRYVWPALRLRFDTFLPSFLPKSLPYIPYLPFLHILPHILPLQAVQLYRYPRTRQSPDHAHPNSRNPLTGSTFSVCACVTFDPLRPPVPP